MIEHFMQIALITKRGKIIEKEYLFDLNCLEEMLDGLKPTTKEASDFKKTIWELFP